MPVLEFAHEFLSVLFYHHLFTRFRQVIQKVLCCDAGFFQSLYGMLHKLDHLTVLWEEQDHAVQQNTGNRRTRVQAKCLSQPLWQRQAPLIVKHSKAARASLRCLLTHCGSQ